VRRREQILFLIVGGWNTAFGYGVFALLYWLLQASVPATAILLLSYAVALINNFLCYKYIVFRTRGGHGGEILRFMVVYVPILLANLIVLPLALRTLPLNAYVIQGIYTVVVVVLSYLGLKLFTFRRS
jgi:putative flippase GtrA